MRGKLFLFGALIVGVLAVLSGCQLTTPEIRGVVLDAETKQPVEGAWMSSTLEVKMKTLQGDVYSYLSVDPPHTRTDKYGRFVIPPRHFAKSPFVFGTEVESWSINASTIDDKGGGFYIDKKKWGKRSIELTVLVKPWTEGLANEREYFSYLQSLYDYCLLGRFGVEVPAVKGGCDDWELDFAIKKHEFYLEKYKNPQLIKNPPYGTSKWDKIIHFSGIQCQLAYLYKQKKDYEKALETFEKVKKFDQEHGFKLSREIENQIKEIQMFLRNK